MGRLFSHGLDPLFSHQELCAHRSQYKTSTYYCMRTPRPTPRDRLVVSDLPLELLSLVASHLTTTDILRLSSCSVALRRLARVPTTYSDMDLSVTRRDSTQFLKNVSPDNSVYARVMNTRARMVAAAMGCSRRVAETHLEAILRAVRMDNTLVSTETALRIVALPSVVVVSLVGCPLVHIAMFSEGVRAQVQWVDRSTRATSRLRLLDLRETFGSDLPERVRDLEQAVKDVFGYGVVIRPGLCWFCPGELRNVCTNESRENSDELGIDMGYAKCSDCKGKPKFRDAEEFCVWRTPQDARLIESWWEMIERAVSWVRTLWGAFSPSPSQTP